MRKMLPMLAAVGLLAGCEAGHQQAAEAYRREAERLAAENRRVSQKYETSRTVLSTSNMSLVISACGLGACLFMLLHRRRSP